MFQGRWMLLFCCQVWRLHWTNSLSIESCLDMCLEMWFAASVRRIHSEQGRGWMWWPPRATIVGDALCRMCWWIRSGEGGLPSLPVNNCTSEGFSRPSLTLQRRRTLPWESSAKYISLFVVISRSSSIRSGQNQDCGVVVSEWLAATVSMMLMRGIQLTNESIATKESLCCIRTRR